MKKFISLVLVLSLFSLSGCVLLLVGGAATGGYALSKDSAEGILDQSYDKVWNAAYKTTKEKGVVKVADEAHGRIEAEIDDVDMKIQLDRVGKAASRLKITGRKNLMPKAKQAEEVFVAIQNRLK